MLHTPAGKTSFKSSPILSMQSGVKGDGLRTIVLPAASAGAIFQTDRLTGKFHGEIAQTRSEEHTSELQSLMRISYAVFCLKTKQINIYLHSTPSILHYQY